MTRVVAIAGSTGSVGTQALEVVRAEPDRFTVSALSASSSVDALVEQAWEFTPRMVGIGDASLAGEVRDRVPPGTTVVAGDEVAAVAEMGEVVLNAVVGFAGLPVTLAALDAGRCLALANKESLIAAGPVVQQARATPGAEIVPVDSEHCAIHQCLRTAGDVAGERDVVRRIVLTASGGPFRGRNRAELGSVTVADALSHPTWSMGSKITVDSSTLMNKGLEVIEANELFGVGFDRIDVVVHPQSIVHSMVEFTDGATVAQLSMPDMRLPIAYALGYPARVATPFGAIDWARVDRLDFEAPDTDAFACLALAYDAGRAGGTAPAWLSAANEVAVEAFLAGRLPWLSIAAVIRETMESWDGAGAESLDVVLDADRRARRRAGEIVERSNRAA
ncbi:MAG TPA: 1-deoxy-D-xylulose-5-phosphate reductoisomerase [Acidimicrobiales bacterium]|nr:1-deoxy-D-xylulose-5-phosphate reductoisomerase [Acidimicrobiales bacterium]